MRRPRDHHITAAVAKSDCPGGRDCNRQRRRLTEEAGGRIDARDINQHPRHQPTTPEGRAVVTQGRLVFGATIEKVEHCPGQSAPGLCPQILDRPGTANVAGGRRAIHLRH